MKMDLEALVVVLLLVGLLGNTGECAKQRNRLSSGVNGGAGSGGGDFSPARAWLTESAVGVWVESAADEGMLFDFPRQVPSCYHGCRNMRIAWNLVYFGMTKGSSPIFSMPFRLPQHCPVRFICGRALALRAGNALFFSTGTVGRLGLSEGPERLVIGE